MSAEKVDLLLKQPRIIPKTCCDNRSTQLITFHPCHPLKIHTHGKWTYECSAWNLQDKGHCGTGGQCYCIIQTSDWNKVLDFYNMYKDKEYCSINAQRQSNSKEINEHYTCTVGTTQYVTLYIKCDGCECNNDNFEDWIVLGKPSKQCTDELCKPNFKTLKRKQDKELKTTEPRMNVNDTSTRIVVYYSDEDGLMIMRVPVSELETEDGKEIVNAITGDDIRFQPYTSFTPNTEFITKIEGKVKVWFEKYKIKQNENSKDVIFGSYFN
jgi:hypothetical protein